MDTLHKNMKIDELLILTTDEREKVSFGRYWGNKPDSTEKAHADMLEMWSQKKMAMWFTCFALRKSSKPQIIL